MSEMALIPLDDYKDICDAVREKTGSTETIKSGDMASLISEISGGGDDGQSYALIERSITEVRSNVSIVGNSAFSSCTKLTSANLPVATSIGTSAFRDCSLLTSVDFPVATSIGGYAFQSCSLLTSVDFPVATSIGISAFYSCTKLKSVDFPVATSIGNSAFNFCSALTSLIIRTTSQVCTYSTTSSAYDPKNANLKIYVPRALVDSYKTATNWVRLADKIVALEDYTVDGTTTGELDPTKVGA